MTKPPQFDPMHLSDAMRESAQQIWLAGVGAFSKAQQEGGKVFENLVNDGLSIQRKTQAVAEEKWQQATQRMTDMAEQISTKTTGTVDRLEAIFEDRVHKALARHGYPTPQDWLALQQRVQALENRLEQASGTPLANPTSQSVRTGNGKRRQPPASPNPAAQTRAKSSTPASTKTQRRSTPASVRSRPPARKK